MIIGFFICIGLITWGSNAFKQQQELSKSDPRVYELQLTLGQYSKLQSVPDLERSLSQIEELANQLKSKRGYEFAFELAHVHRIKAKWILAQSKLNRDDQAETFKERAQQEVERGEFALQTWKKHWEGLTANQILERIKSDFLEDPTMAQHPQLMIIVGGRADQIIQAMKDYDLLKHELEKLRPLE